MNRPLKFRVWVPEEKIFRYCEYIPTMGFVWNMNGTSLEIGEGYSQQFIGMKDKNGKEIYEGDIIKEKHYEDWGDNEGFYYIGEVYWSPLACGFRTLPKANILILGNVFSLDCEVIGNIFETPKLLNTI